MKTKINWAEVDWRFYDAEIARQLDRSKTIVGEMRKKHSKVPKGFELDEDGYPTIPTLKRIRNWPIKDKFDALLVSIRPLWRYAESGYWSETKSLVKVYELSTAGWSGNEEIIQALQQNHVFWAICWQQSTRGGHYVFHVKS